MVSGSGRALLHLFCRENHHFLKRKNFFTKNRGSSVNDHHVCTLILCRMITFILTLTILHRITYITAFIKIIDIVTITSGSIVTSTNIIVRITDAVSRKIVISRIETIQARVYCAICFCIIRVTKNRHMIAARR